MIDQSSKNTNRSKGQCDSHTTFMLPIRVYYEDTDAGGVVYHANYISFFERARTEWMRQLGYELDELARDEQLIFVVRALSCEYLLPAKFNDELFVSAEILELGKTSIQFQQKVMRASKNNETRCEILTKGIVTVVAVDSQKFKAKRLPKHILEVMRSVI
jgi:acyl-CoA thioester hydrolase